ncbi:PREDICTED: late embryogenesis abundant protein 2-like [Tarenaya hassleriana]|uniref:late embryogenesis abundant protein 2-like n=1 Tax=Tarenaya hassleriana TaxID=28532 RepID=UPI00053C5966|nr:PREDICTED: late embryogenesis abundant protein 2-like [Tarenaya hassleriana]
MSSTQELSHKAGEITGQAQIKKDEYVNKASNALNEASQNSESDQNNPSITSQASSFLQQTGVQVKSMAQGAADAVKNTLGMNSDNNTGNPTTGRNHPTNPGPRV